MFTDKEQDMHERIGNQTNKMVMESNLIKISNKTTDELTFLQNLLVPIITIKQKILIFNNIIDLGLGICFKSMEPICYAVF